MKQNIRYIALLIFILLSIPPALQAHIERLGIVVVSKIRHDPAAYTQGLAIDGDILYESTGLHGQSSLRCMRLPSGTIVQAHRHRPEVFAEGIALFPDTLLQITWKNRQAILYDRATLTPQKMLSYKGEGWGLCRDGEWVWMSDGSSIITKRDPATLSVLQSLEVKCAGFSVFNINDIESVGQELFANIWLENCIIRIHKQSGQVTGWIDASSLLSSEEKAVLRPDDVLNGIAYRSSTDTFFLTGKRWPWIFEVSFIKY